MIFTYLHHGLLGPQHGYGILLRIEQLSKGSLQIEQGSLYPARLEHKGFIVSDWGESNTNRKAKFYQLTAAGKRQLRSETESWRLLAARGSSEIFSQNA
jgi:PadR family transcriptional regulator, regulatory protein PadR